MYGGQSRKIRKAVTTVLSRACARAMAGIALAVAMASVNINEIRRRLRRSGPAEAAGSTGFSAARVWPNENRSSDL